MSDPLRALAHTYRTPCDARHERRLLLITYSFPPDTAVGALRWQKFARYADERGWGLDVVTVDPSQLARRDATRLDELPPDVRVVGVRHRDVALTRIHRGLTALRRAIGRRRPSGPRRGRSMVSTGGDIASGSTGGGSRELAASQELWRGYLAMLEYTSFRRWARDAARVALAHVVDANAHVAVITSGPPHMAHEAGRLVARRSGIPLVLDMRDPWGIDEGLDFEAAGMLWYRVARWYERRAVAAASLIVANTEGARKAVERAYPAAAQRTLTVMNGFDDDDPKTAESPHSPRFVIAFAGSIYLDRTPVPLFRALARLVAAEGLSPREVGIELMGHVSHFAGRPVLDLAREAGVEAFVTLHEPRPRREAQAFLASAAVLVSLPQNSRLTVPAKMFEYMQFNSWVVALSDPGSATADLLRDTGADSVSPDDVESLAAILSKRLAEFRRGERPRAIASDPQFSRRAQATVLFDALARFDTPADRAASRVAGAVASEAAESV